MSKSRMNSELQFQHFIKNFLSFIFRGQEFRGDPFFTVSNIEYYVRIIFVWHWYWPLNYWIFLQSECSSQRTYIFGTFLYEKNIVFVKNCEKRMRKNRRWFKIQCVWRPRIWVERIWKRMFSSCGLTSKHKCRKGVTNIACVINPTGFQLDKSGFQAHQNYHMYFTIANPISSDSWTKNFTLSRPDETFGSWSEQTTLIVWSTNDSCTLLELRWK